MFSTTLKRVRPSMLYSMQMNSKPCIQADSFHASLYRVPQPQEISRWPHRIQHRIQNVTFSSAATEKECWRCKKSSGNDFFCDACHAVQRLSPNYNFFSVFGLEQQFDIDLSRLKTKFRKLQSTLHPDKFSSASQEEKEISAEMSSLVNSAYKTLTDPLTRGLYMLQLHGGEISEDNTSSDNALLMEIMELNEELESLNTSGKIQDFQTRIQNVFSDLSKQLVGNFQENNIDGAKETLSRMRYIKTLQEKVIEKKNKLISVT